MRCIRSQSCRFRMVVHRSLDFQVVFFFLKMYHHLVANIMGYSFNQLLSFQSTEYVTIWSAQSLALKMNLSKFRSNCGVSEVLDDTLRNERAIHILVFLFDLHELLSATIALIQKLIERHISPNLILINHLAKQICVLLIICEIIVKTLLFGFFPELVHQVVVINFVVRHFIRKFR